jgi:hypothetical protein
MESNLCLVEVGTVYSIQSLGYVMDDLRFKSRQGQEITSLLQNMLINSRFTHSGKQTDTVSCFLRNMAVGM